MNMNRYSMSYQEAVSDILQRQRESQFRLRDTTKEPYPLVGRWLYQAVQAGIIPNVVCLGHIDGDANLYKKI